MSKPTYSSAKIYFTVLEIVAILMLILGLILSIDLYQNAGALVGLGAAASTVLIFLAINAFNQIGLATIHTAENTRRMADMMEADRRLQTRGTGSEATSTPESTTKLDPLVAKR